VRKVIGKRRKTLPCRQEGRSPRQPNPKEKKKLSFEGGRKYLLGLECGKKRGGKGSRGGGINMFTEKTEATLIE